LITDTLGILNLRRSSCVVLLALLLVACRDGERRFSPTFFVERVPSDSLYSVGRADLPGLHQQGTPSASVTLNDDTRRALTPSLPSRLTFAAKLPPQSVLDFSLAVATIAKPERWAPILFRVAINDGSGEETAFRETVRLAERNQWLDRTLDLGAWSEKEVQIVFEITIDGSGASTDPVYPLWGNPVLYSSQNRRERPPIILISVDCLRPDHMGLYGYERNTTPRLDAFSSDGAVFTAASSASSWTLPAHMSMLTGLTPSFHAVTRERKLAPSVAYLPQLLSQAGYEVDGVVSGAYLSPNFGFEPGFHNYRVLPSSPAEQTVAQALHLLQRARGRDFFLFLHVIDPHWRYLPPEDFVERYGPRPPDLDALLNRVIERAPPSSPQDVERLKNLYDGEIAYVDQEVGRLLDWLEAQELYESSLIIVTSDHGEAFYEHEHWQHSETLYQEMIRVPLIVKWPVEWPGRPHPLTVHTPVSLVDLLPTILESAGLPPPRTQGKSLTRYRQPSEPSKEEATISEVIWWSPEPAGKKVSIRSRNLKYIATFQGETNDDLTIGKMVREELYDLTVDPEEKNNLETSGPMEAFRKQLHAHLEEARRFRNDQETGGAVVIDETVRERLRALGYLQ